jgi:hypothetical protein
MRGASLSPLGMGRQAATHEGEGGERARERARERTCVRITNPESNYRMATFVTVLP